MAYKTLAQLRHCDWPSREAAMKDLKASGLKERGSDYRLGEYKPGHWQLLDLADGAPHAGTPPKVHPADKADRAKIAEAVG